MNSAASIGGTETIAQEPKCGVQRTSDCEFATSLGDATRSASYVDCHGFILGEELTCL